MTVVLSVYVETPRQRELLPSGQRATLRKENGMSRPRSERPDSEPPASAGPYPTPRNFVPRYTAPAGRAQSGRPLFVQMHQASDR
jgi:hypothetical protein